MTELAQKHGIQVILCSVLPISDYAPMRSNGQQTAEAPRKIIQSTRRPPSQIVQLNEWLKKYATSVGATYADYFSATVDEKGMLKEGYSDDGLHPNAKGYALMAPVAEAAIAKAVN